MLDEVKKMLDEENMSIFCVVKKQKIPDEVNMFCVVKKQKKECTRTVVDEKYGQCVL